MHSISFLRLPPRLWFARARHIAQGWWYVVHLGAVALVMAMSPSTYTRENRLVTARYLYTYTWQVLPWFTVLASLVSLVIIRIVVVTAYSYGLTRFAVEMVVRVLVLELIPLTAALFVAIRAGFRFHAADLLARAADKADDSALAQERLRRDLVPQLLANIFAVLSLAMASSAIVLFLAYVVRYGFSPWALDDYTRTVGRVFDPTVTIGFLFKTFFFGLAVAVIPTAALLRTYGTGVRRRSNVQPGAVGLLFVLFMIEAASLLIKYI
jgi:phospholipid/cholesterol/gamma-HCH transport system permease protein